MNSVQVIDKRGSAGPLSKGLRGERPCEKGGGESRESEVLGFTVRYKSLLHVLCSRTSPSSFHSWTDTVQTQSDCWSPLFRISPEVLALMSLVLVTAFQKQRSKQNKPKSTPGWFASRLVCLLAYGSWAGYVANATKSYAVKCKIHTHWVLRPLHQQTQI